MPLSFDSYRFDRHRIACDSCGVATAPEQEFGGVLVVGDNLPLDTVVDRRFFGRTKTGSMRASICLVASFIVAACHVTLPIVGCVARHPRFAPSASYTLLGYAARAAIAEPSEGCLVPIAISLADHAPRRGSEPIGALTLRYGRGAYGLTSQVGDRRDRDVNERDAIPPSATAALGHQQSEGGAGAGGDIPSKRDAVDWRFAQ